MSRVAVRFMRYAPVFEVYQVTNRFSSLFSGATVLALAGRMAAPPSTPSTMAKQHPLMLALLTGSSIRNLYIGTRSAATPSRSHYRDADAPTESQPLISL